VLADNWRSLNDRFSRLTSHSLEIGDGLLMAIAELHSAIFIAIKRPIATVCKWPLPVIRPFQKANLNTVHSDF
jgi:hypothetical protein